MAEGHPSKRFPRLALIRGGKRDGSGPPPAEPPSRPRCPDFHSEAHLLTAISGLAKIITAHASNADPIDDPERLDTFCCALWALGEVLDDKLAQN